MQQRPVLYLDLDDTVISWAGGTPAGAVGLREFLEWALAVFEVRWLTRWARNGEVETRLVHDLARMSGVAAERLGRVQGLSWEETDCKLNGIAWLEHVVQGRPFLWIEDETVGTATTEFLVRHGFARAYVSCNVTRDPDALLDLHRRLARTYASEHDAGLRDRSA